MALDLRAHVYSKVPDTNQIKLVRENHYASVRDEKGGGPFFLQQGKCYASNGIEISPLPQWVSEAVARMTPRFRDVIGFGEKKVETAVPPKEQAPAPSAPAKKRGRPKKVVESQE